MRTSAFRPPIRWGRNEEFSFASDSISGLVYVGDSASDSRHAMISLASVQGDRQVGCHLWLPADSRVPINDILDAILGSFEFTVETIPDRPALVALIAHAEASRDAFAQNDPVAAVRAALPSGWKISEVNWCQWPWYRRPGKGVEIVLVEEHAPSIRGSSSAFVFLMPPDYRDDITVGGHPSKPPDLVATLPGAKVYMAAGSDEMRNAMVRALKEHPPRIDPTVLADMGGSNGGGRPGAGGTNFVVFIQAPWGDLNAVMQKMKRIVIPEIEFRQANIADVLEFLTEASAEYDTGAEPKGIRPVLGDGPPPPERNEDGPLSEPLQPLAVIPPITLNARNISLFDLMNGICKTAGLSWKISENGPKGLRRR